MIDISINGVHICYAEDPTPDPERCLSKKDESRLYSTLGRGR